MAEPKLILDNLWQVGGDDLTGSADAAAYLIRFGDEAALIDAGCGDGHQALLDNIMSCLSPDIQLSKLFLTHCHYDHTGGAAGIKKAFGCEIVVHEQDAEFLARGDNTVTAASWYGADIAPLEIDIRLQGKKNTLKIGTGHMTAIHWPGHSPGSIILTTQVHDQLVLFGQDVHGPIHPALRSDELAYQRSLKYMLDLEADLLLEGHFGVFRGKANVRKFIRSFLR